MFKKTMITIGLVSLLVLTSCWNNSNDSGSGEYENAGKEHFLVLTNDSPEDISIGALRSARNAVSPEISQENFIKFLEENNIPAIIDANIEDKELFELLKRAENSNPSNRDVNPSIALQTNASAVGDTQTFWVYDVDLNATNTHQYAFQLKAIGQKCLIWLRTSTAGHPEPDFGNFDFSTLASSLDAVFDHEMSIYGSNVINIYQDDLISAPAGTKLNVLLYDICSDGNPTAGSAVLGGLFANKDVIKQSAINSENPNIHSNQCECISADSYLLKRDIDYNRKFITSTLAHEFQHMLHLINKTFIVGQSSETWFNEMLSLCAEDIFQSQLGVSDADSPKSRLSLFNLNYRAGFRNWATSNIDQLKNYANVYAFGAYLMRNYGGINLIHQMATNSYGNENAITYALQALGFDEDFYSVLHKFANAIVFPADSVKPTLNKQVQQTFGGVNYNLSAINLLNWGSAVNPEEVPYFYDSANRIQTSASGQTIFYGPLIVTEEVKFNLTGIFGSYGSYAIYYGKVDSKPGIYSQNDITQTVLCID